MLDSVTNFVFKDNPLDAMEKLTIENNIKVFGFHVTTFPSGVGEAFNTLISRIPMGNNHSYYGLSYFDQGKIIYIAAAEELANDEAEKFGYKRYTIEKGNYLTISVRQWRQKTDSIKNVFEEIIHDPRIQPDKPCVEWYKDDTEMLCMVKMK